MILAIFESIIIGYSLINLLRMVKKFGKKRWLIRFYM